MKPYKGYTATITYDADAKVFFGEVVDIRDVITFEATDAASLEKEFHASVDDYLAWAKEDGFEPQKPFSGKLAFRTTPQRHRMISEAASAEASSINQWMDEVLARAAEERIAEGHRKVKTR
jgi:predicted HicB family RNase H-like nuclease